ncbi:hypothetical protein H4R18_005195 [Coemansia javaensis]|uniref:CST complex subunit Ten1 n=1 Tax=Coemansia javaensis TaxID=2761396 RepID=A0A9W8LFS0_9FUNG|nr:hypothetical protein H4R18_005195 [Coemansia javaensis]
MYLEPGRPVFLDELVAEPARHVGQTVRVTGTLHSYSPALDRAALVDGQYLLGVDTRLLGVRQYHVGQTYQLIGVVAAADGDGGDGPVPPDQLPEDARWAPQIALQARVAKEADGLDMAIYRKSVHALRRFLGTEPQAAAAADRPGTEPTHGSVG